MDHKLNNYDITTVRKFVLYKTPNKNGKVIFAFCNLLRKNWPASTSSPTELPQNIKFPHYNFWKNFLPLTFPVWNPAPPPPPTLKKEGRGGGGWGNYEDIYSSTSLTMTLTCIKLFKTTKQKTKRKLTSISFTRFPFNSAPSIFLTKVFNSSYDETQTHLKINRFNAIKYI